MGDNIFLVPERVKRLAARLHKWVALRRTPPAERKVALLVYGFPPGVGATGTAALLNVPASLEALLRTLAAVRALGWAWAGEEGAHGEARGTLATCA